MVVFWLQNYYAADSLAIWINKQHFNKGDTMQIEISLNKLNVDNRMQSVFVLIENLETKQTNEFRYPLINGFVYMEYVIDSQMKAGNYAINFLLNPQFYTVNAVVNQGLKKEQQLKYTLLTKHNNGLVDNIQLSEPNKFTLKNLVYPDTAFILFSAIQKRRRNDLDINIETPLDSTFTPKYIVTNFFSIATTDTVQLQKLIQNKDYDWKKSKYKNVGELVTVYGKKNNKLLKFEKEKISATFKSIDEIIIDGLSSDEIANAPDLFTFLTTKIPGLNSTTNSENGTNALIYRKEKVVIFVNELKLADDDFPNINTDDIALVKFFRSNPLLTNGSSAVLAIYTKGINDYAKPKNKYSFKIMGYNPQTNMLK
jgi:hypothetical protein